MDVEKQETSDYASITWLLVYTAVTMLVIHQLYSFTYLWRIGIPGPMPLPVIGNYHQILRAMIPSLVKWSKKYGKFYGFYGMGRPVLMTTDVDIARQILIKDFSSFQGREDTTVKIPYLASSLLMTKGEPWKRARAYMSPAFSGSKMKQMIPTLNENCDILTDILGEICKKGNTFETKKVYGSYVLDNVACCAFGIDADCQRNPDDQFVKHAKDIFQIKISRPGVLLRMFAPSLSPLLDKLGIDMLPRESLDFFANIIKRAMELRQEGSGGERRDFLQLMIEAAEMEDETGTVKSADEARDDSDIDQQVSNETRKKIPLTTEELIGQSMLFFFAGYNTVSTTLSFASYALAKYPDVQKKVQEEVDELTSEGEPVSYDAVSKMEYLDKVFCESQRMWPVGFILKRKCNQAITYEGLHIPYDMMTEIDVWSIHHDPQHYPDPYTFNPENFSKEAKESRHPCAFLPFGAGPRNCVGIRFAIFESKIALIHIMQKYSFELPPDTKDLTDINNFNFLYPKQGIHLRIVTRE